MDFRNDDYPPDYARDRAPSVFEKSVISYVPESEIIQIDNFLIDLSRVLGAGEFGKVYLAQEIPDDADLDASNINGAIEDDVTENLGRSNFGNMVKE